MNEEVNVKDMYHGEHIYMVYGEHIGMYYVVHQDM